jgi:hypothetical protein
MQQHGGGAQRPCTRTVRLVVADATYQVTARLPRSPTTARAAHLPLAAACCGRAGPSRQSWRLAARACRQLARCQMPRAPAVPAPRLRLQLVAAASTRAAVAAAHASSSSDTLAGRRAPAALRGTLTRRAVRPASLRAWLSCSSCLATQRRWAPHAWPPCHSNGHGYFVSGRGCTWMEQAAHTRLVTAQPTQACCAPRGSCCCAPPRPTVSSGPSPSGSDHQLGVSEDIGAAAAHAMGSGSTQASLLNRCDDGCVVASVANPCRWSCRDRSMPGAESSVCRRGGVRYSPGRISNAGVCDLCVSRGEALTGGLSRCQGLSGGKHTA